MTAMMQLSYALSCLDAGKHVLLEKPVAHTVESCVRLIDRAAKTDKVFMVGENSQFWPEASISEGNDIETLA